MINGRYLKITMHDNDFTSSLAHVGYLLQQIFEYEEKYPKEQDFPVLKELIKHLWYGTHNIMGKVRWNDYGETPIEYFNCQLEFIKYSDIPYWDDCSSIYIPMFIGEILIR